MYEYLDRRYALALYERAEEKGKVDEYIKDLEEIVELMRNNKEFLTIVKHPRIGTTTKKEMFINIFKSNIDEDLLSFLLILIDKDRLLYLEEKLKEMKKIQLERNNTLLAEVITVIPLTENQKQLLKDRLEKKYDMKIIFSETIDEDIIGGMYVRVGDDVIDGTIRSKLSEMKKIILST